MTRLRHLYTWLMAFAIVGGMMAFGAWSDHKLAEGNARHSHDWAARKICGENAGYRWVDDKTLQCLSKRGVKTGAVVAAQEITP